MRLLAAPACEGWNAGEHPGPGSPGRAQGLERGLLLASFGIEPSAADRAASSEQADVLTAFGTLVRVVHGFIEAGPRWLRAKGSIRIGQESSRGWCVQSSSSTRCPCTVRT